MLIQASGMRIAFCFVVLLLCGAVAAQEYPGSPGTQSERLAQTSQLELAEDLFGRSQYRKAQELAREIVKADPQHQEALFLLGRIAIATEDLQESQRIATLLLQLGPEEADHHILQGMVTLLEGNPGGSIDDFERALRLGKEKKSSSKLASYGNTLVLAYYQAGRLPEALDRCRSLLEQYPNDGNLHLSCSRLYRESGKMEAARDVALQGLERAPDFHRLYASLALALAGLGEVAAAEQAFLELKKHEPGLAKQLRETLDGIRADKPEFEVHVD